jgi:hypothetical protein
MSIHAPNTATTYTRILDGEREILRLKYEGIAKDEFYSYRIEFVEIREIEWSDALTFFGSRSEIPYVIERADGVRVSFAKSKAYYWINQHKMLFMQRGIKSISRFFRQFVGRQRSYSSALIVDMQFVYNTLMRFQDGDRELLRFKLSEQDEKWFVYTVEPVGLELRDFEDLLYDRVPVLPTMFFECSDGKKVPFDEMFFARFESETRTINVR